MNRTFLLLALAALASTPALAGKKLAEPDVVEDALAFATQDRAKAIQLLEEAIASGAHADIAPLLMLHAGEQHRLAGTHDEAHRWFAKVVEVQDKGAEVEAARLGLALLASSGGGPDSNTARVLERISDKTALATQNADRYLALATAAAREDDAARAKAHAAEALDWADEDPEVRDRVEAAIASLARDDARPAQPAGVPAGGKLTLVDKAEAAWQGGDDAKARRLAEQVLADTPDTPDADAAAYLIARMDGAPIRADRIGLLLPTEGKYASAARQLREAFELGYGAPGPQLVVQHSGEDAEGAVAGLESLVLEQGVVAVVGPLRKDVADPVLRAAEALRVPIVSLAQVDAILEGEQWTFQGMTTPSAQAEALVSHLTGVEGMSAFGIFAPDNPYGHTAADVFTASAEAHGATVTVTEFYDPTATDLIPFAKALGRKDYDARGREFYDLRRAAEESGANPSRVVLPPVLDFQGLFLPDSAARVPLACAALAYEEFPVGQFQTVRHGPTVPLLGLSSWNNPSLVTAGNVYVRSSRFTDVYFGGDEAGLAFAATYKASTERTPTALEAVAHAVGSLVGDAAATGPTDRVAFRQALLDVALEEATVTGAPGFDPGTRAAAHAVRILSMNEDAIIPVDLPADEGEGGEE